jgi:DNA-directed RNA polymerase alpha subunit
MKNQIINFIGTANYQGDDLGTYIWGNRPDGTREIIAVVYGYNTDTEKNEGKEVAELFQDKLGMFIAKAINEKIERDRLLNPILDKNCLFENIDGSKNFNLSVRLLNRLRYLEIYYPIELTKIKRKDLTKYKNFGKVTEFQLDNFMKELGIKFLGE